MNFIKFGKVALASFGLGAFAITLLVLAPVSGSFDVSAQRRLTAPSSIIYDNGPFITGATSRSGVAASAGTQWSESSYEYGSTTETNTTIGVGCQVIGTATSNRCADDFNVPVGQSWTINQVILFAYQTGFVGATSPFVGANLQIWRGRPGDPGSVIVFGNTTTNRLGTSTDALVYRIANSGPPLNTVPGTTRRVWQNNVSVSPAAVLTAGNYWIDFQLDTGAVTGNFTPPATITGARTIPGWNARQFITATVWSDLVDAGNPATAMDVAQEFPFKLDGSIAGAPATPRSRVVDFNGDNKSDLVVARSAGSTSQTTWWTNDGTNVYATPFGLGVGFGGGDIATPRDFDGDGKADISVWRSNTGDANRAYFYTLQSSNSTVVANQFGRTGDDPTIVEDYDGDGKADYAVFRSTPAPGFDPCGGSAAWYYKPSATPATPFSYVCWGSAGDRVYPGDFDGDRKADFVVVRNAGGNANIYQNLSGGGTNGFQYGLFTDNFVSGDFDADGRTDLCVVRSGIAGQFVWYLTKSGTGQLVSFNYGNQATDYLVPADYDGDGKTDFAIWRSGAVADSGYFYQLKTFTSPGGVKFGTSTVPLSSPDLPVASTLVLH